jgi:Putative porin
LDLWGDLRFREYYNQLEPQLPAPPGATAYDVHQQRNRLRLNADFLLANNFFSGVQLSTSDNRDAASQNATHTGGFDNYNIYSLDELL